MRKILMTFFFNEEFKFYFLTLTKISSDLTQWVISRVAKTTFCVARWRLYGMKSVHERIYFLQSFMIWINYFLKCLWKVSSEVVKIAFKVLKRLCWANFSQEVFIIQLLSYFRKVSFEDFEDFFLDKNGLLFFRTSKEISSALWRVCFGRQVKTAF